jgi:hypothetical protein
MAKPEYSDVMSRLFGVKITQNELNHIFDLYRKVTGSTDTRYPSLSSVGLDLADYHSFEYRIGSRWSGDSKLEINNNRVTFYPNCTPRNARIKKQIEKAVKSFEEEVKDYLEQLKKQNQT